MQNMHIKQITQVGGTNELALVYRYNENIDHLKIQQQKLTRQVADNKSKLELLSFIKKPEFYIRYFGQILSKLPKVTISEV